MTEAQRSERSRRRAIAGWLGDFPVLLFRARLGWLFRGRLVMLVHRGRRTGLVRYTVLEVVRHDPTSGERVVLSGRGRRADWYRNLEAAPAEELWVGARRLRVVHRVLEGERAASEFRTYARTHRRLADRVAARLGCAGDLEEAGRRVRFVVFLPV